MEKRILQHLFGLFFASLPLSSMWSLWSENAFASGALSVWTSFFVSIPSFLLLGIFGYGVFLFFQKKISLPTHFAISTQEKNLFLIVISLLFFMTVWLEDPWLHIFSFLHIVLALVVFSYFEDSRENWICVGRYFLGSMGLISIIALFQFMLQHSTGFHFLGEPNIAPDILGVAKIDIGSIKYIRSYGTFLHPNILAFFSIIAFYIAKRIGWKYLKWFFILPLILSFSRAGFLAFIVSYFFTFRSLRKNELLLALAIIGLGIGLTIPFLAARFHIFDAAFFERLDGIGASILMLFSHPLGVGLKHFTLWLQDSSAHILAPWEFQPVHNVFLLILNEIGIFAGAIVFWMLWQIWKQAMPWQKQVLMVLFIVALFDHYLWTSLSAQLFVLFFFTICLQKKS